MYDSYNVESLKIRIEILQSKINKINVFLNDVLISSFEESMLKHRLTKQMAMLYCRSNGILINQIHNKDKTLNIVSSLISTNDTYQQIASAHSCSKQRVGYIVNSCKSAGIKLNANRKKYTSQGEIK